MVDVVIIGAGVVGCSIARELSRWNLDTLVLERGPDVCVGTSKANSGIVHAGHDAKPGSVKARFNIEGSRMMPALSEELGFPFERNGSLVLGFRGEDMAVLEELLDKGRQNGVEGLEIISGDRARKMEPNLSDAVKAALWAPTGGIVDPFLLTVAMAENAAVNGVQFEFNTEVIGVAAAGARQEECRCGAAAFAGEQAAGEGTALASKRIGIQAGPGNMQEVHYIVSLQKPDGSVDTMEARAVVNAAGVYADVFHNMVSSRRLHITPRKGQYMLMDKATVGFVKSTIFQCPTEMGKGVLVTPTAHGNLMIGPTAEDIEDRENTATTADSLDYVTRCAGLSAKALPTRQVITSFSGLRAHEDSDDFVIGEPEDAPYFFDAAGIESPGLTSAPAIGAYLAQSIAEKLTAPVNDGFDGHRDAIPCMSGATMEERERLIRQNPQFANVICRCEMVTEGEIVEAITRPVGARTLDGIKRRVRAGMGRCQAGFCMPKQAEILSRETGMDLGDVTKTGGQSNILVGYTKE